MYTIKVESDFDSAHFLKNYKGKCSNIHGHRWKVIVEVSSEELNEDSQTNGMVLDFGDLKKILKKITEKFDHSLIIEKNSLQEITLKALKEEGFRIIEMDFRTTAENFSKYFYDNIRKNGYNVTKVEVYETPTNCAIYEGEK